MLETSTPSRDLAEKLRARILDDSRKRSAMPSGSWTAEYVAEQSRLRAALKAEWAAREGLIQAQGRLTYQRLFGRLGDYLDWRLPADDHVSMWRRSTDRGVKISRWISQPYPLSPSAIREMMDASERLGLEFSIATRPAWHYPGSVLFVEWQVREQHEM